jgi:hypothetical protein
MGQGLSLLYIGYGLGAVSQVPAFPVMDHCSLRGGGGAAPNTILI